MFISFCSLNEISIKNYGSDVDSEYFSLKKVPLNFTLIALSVIACIFDLVTGGGSEHIEANSSLKDES